MDSSRGTRRTTWSRSGSQLTAPRPRAGFGQHRQAVDGAVEARHELQRIIAGDDEAGVRLRRRPIARRLAGEADDDGRGGDGGGEAIVVRWQLRGLPDERRQLRLLGEQLGELARRQPIRLGEDEVERDGARAVRLELVDDLGEARARPRPLADAGERSVVDIDDAHGQPRIDLARLEVEIGVEHGEPQPRHRLGVGDAQRHRQDEQRRRKQDVDGKRAQGGHLICGTLRAAGGS